MAPAHLSCTGAASVCVSPTHRDLPGWGFSARSVIGALRYLPPSGCAYVHAAIVREGQRVFVWCELCIGARQMRRGCLTAGRGEEECVGRLGGGALVEREYVADPEPTMVRRGAIDGQNALVSVAA